MALLKPPPLPAYAASIATWRLVRVLGVYGARAASIAR
jgi:hypothetical protein